MRQKLLAAVCEFVLAATLDEAAGYIKGGNFQIHQLTGYDDGGIIPIEE